MQVLVTQSAARALTDTVLPRRARFDGKNLHANRRQPLLDRRRDELRTVVAPKSFRNAVHRKQFRQSVDRIFARDTATNLGRQAWPSVLVDDVQEANGSPVKHRRLDEVPGPNVVDKSRGLNVARIAPDASCTLFASLSGHLQSGSFPKSIHLLHVDGLTVAAKELTNALIAPARTLANKLKNPLGQSFVFIFGLPLKSLTRPRLIEHAASTSLGYVELLLKLVHRRASRLRGSQFPLVISFSIEMSKAWSATIFLSRLFSSSSALSRLASSLFMPPYWLRQRLSVASLTSSACRTSPMLLSAASMASASRSFLMICSGECRRRFLLMENPSPEVALDFHNP